MTNEELDEIVADLRDEDATAKANEGDYYADQFAYHGCGDAANAIEWLRAEVERRTLNAAEREAVEWVLANRARLAVGFGRSNTFRSMLARLGGKR